MSLLSSKKNKQTLGHWLCVTGFLAFFSGNAHATLINADFSSGFDGWMGDYTYFDASSGVDVDVLNATTLPSEMYSNNGGGSVTLMTAFYPEPGDEAYFVSLFQEFVMDSVTTGNQLVLSLSVLSSVSASDFFSVQLEDLSGSLGPLDLSSGGTFDITAWAGTDAILSFIVADENFDLDESITISSLAISQVTQNVSEPSVLGLFVLAGLVLLRRKIN